MLTLSEKRLQSMREYKKNHLKRIPLDVTKEKYAEIKRAADLAGMSVNGYIKSAIDDRIKSDRQ